MHVLDDVSGAFERIREQVARMRVPAKPKLSAREKYLRRFRARQS
jgi:hypothetical protein